MDNEYVQLFITALINQVFHSKTNVKIKCVASPTNKITPKAVKFDSKTLEQKQWIFSTSNVTFLPNGEAKVVFHGIKNDTSHSGFDVIVKLVQDPQFISITTVRYTICTVKNFFSSFQKLGVAGGGQPNNFSFFFFFFLPYGSQKSVLLKNVLLTVGNQHC